MSVKKQVFITVREDEDACSVLCPFFTPGHCSLFGETLYQVELAGGFARGGRPLYSRCPQCRAFV